MTKRKLALMKVWIISGLVTFSGASQALAEEAMTQVGSPELRLNDSSPIDSTNDSSSAEVVKENLAESQIPLGIEPDVAKVAAEAKKTSPQAEVDIKKEASSGEENTPLFKKSDIKAAATSDSALTKLILTLGVMTAFFAVGWIYLKRWSKRGPSTHDLHKIKVLTQHYLGPKKSLVIIRVAGETMMIGVTENNISMIKSLSLLDEEIPDHVPQDFAGSLDEELRQESSNESEENFALAGLNEVRDRVSRRISNLRNMN